MVGRVSPIAGTEAGIEAGNTEEAVITKPNAKHVEVILKPSRDQHQERNWI